MCFVFCPLYLLPFIIITIELLLSWYSMLSFSSRPCSFGNILAHIIFGKKSLTLTISPSVELFTFSFCFWHLVNRTPHPKDTHPPVWLLLSLWTSYDTSTHNFILVKSSTPKVRFKSIGPFKYCRTLFAFLQSPSFGLDTLVLGKTIFKGTYVVPETVRLAWVRMEQVRLSRVRYYLTSTWRREDWFERNEWSF